MIYLSRIFLDPLSHQVRRNLINCYELHRTLMKGFPNQKGKGIGARKKFNLLYRIETKDNVNGISVLVQSTQKPKWSNLEEKYLVKTINGNNAEVRNIDKFLKSLVEGTRLRFRLMANPTKKIGTSLKKDRIEGKKISNGRRVPLLKEEEQYKWLKRKAEQNGFIIESSKISKELPNMMTREGMKITGYKKGKNPKTKEKGYKLTFNGVQFDGILRITDVDKFLLSISTGIGPAKAFGFGMLSIAKIC